MDRNTGPAEALVEDVIDAGDRVVKRLRFRVHGQHNGIETERVFTEVTTFRNVEMIMVEHFLDREEALKSVGLHD